MQFDLFVQRKPATIHAFPLSRRRKLVDETAEALSVKTFSQGKSYWSRLVRGLWKEMKASGLNAKMIESEIATLADAVSHEMNIRNYYRSSNGGGAA
ncbi:DUF6074 family protein [Brucella anthropi]|uniref:DUF6074 family protein n=1 Tax=Brucella anthropi TaxID=529 RepID=UPI00366A694C